MQRRKFSREFKIEAVKLVRERGVSVAQAGRDLGVHENVLRKWVKEFGFDAAQSFPGHGQMKPEQLEIERLRREVNKLKAERDILKGDGSHHRGRGLGVRPSRRICRTGWSRQS
ncbi:transposase [Bradyrhizobium sp. GM22.5]